MIDNKPENLSPDVSNTQYSNVVNGKTVVKFKDLKDFITIERGGTISGLAWLMGFGRSTFTNTLKGRGKYASCIVIIHRLEKHYNIVVEGDPYR